MKTPSDLCTILQVFIQTAHVWILTQPSCHNSSSWRSFFHWIVYKTLTQKARSTGAHHLKMCTTELKFITTYPSILFLNSGWLVLQQCFSSYPSCLLWLNCGYISDSQYSLVLGKWNTANKKVDVHYLCTTGGVRGVCVCPVISSLTITWWWPPRATVWKSIQ